MSLNCLVPGGPRVPFSRLGGGPQQRSTNRSWRPHRLRKRVFVFFFFGSFRIFFFSEVDVPSVRLDVLLSRSTSLRPTEDFDIFSGLAFPCVRLQLYLPPSLPVFPIASLARPPLASFSRNPVFGLFLDFLIPPRPQCPTFLDARPFLYSFSSRPLGRCC